MKRERPKYLDAVLDSKKKEIELEIIARFRLGCESRGSKYWMGEEGQNYRSCEEVKEFFKYVVEECGLTGRRNIKVEVLLGTQLRKNVAELHEILWRRQIAFRARQRKIKD